MSDDTVTFYDANRRVLAIGSKVLTSGDDASMPPGEVIDFTDWDGDADSEGRTIGIPPAIIVLWPDGEKERCETSALNWTDYMVRQCEDLEVVD